MCCFPKLLRLGLVKYIPKNANKWRGIRLESLIAKIIEQLVANPFFPVIGPPTSIIAPEHIAGKKGMSAELATAMLAMILDANGKTPLYILFADVKGAYDNLWKEALWAKLLDAHPSLIDVRRIAAMCEHFVSQIKEPSFTSEIHSAFIGVPQGGPESGNLFCFFQF